MSIYHLGGDNRRSLKDRVFSFGLGIGMGVISAISPFTASAGELNTPRQEQVKPERNLEDYLLTQNEMNRYGIQLADNNGNPNPYEVPDYMIERANEEVTPFLIGVKKMVVGWYQGGRNTPTKGDDFDIFISATEFNKPKNATRLAMEDVKHPKYEGITTVEGSFLLGIGFEPIDAQRKLRLWLEEYFKERNITHLMNQQAKMIPLALAKF